MDYDPTAILFALYWAALLSIVGSWLGVMLAMVASESKADQFAPSIKILTMNALLGVLAALLSMVLPPLLAITTPPLQWPAALASAAGSMSAPFLVFFLLRAAI